MTLTIHQEEDDKRQLQVTVEVAEERVDKAMRKKARSLSRDINIPGFRKGRVPYGVMLRRFGKDAIRNDAVEDMVNEIFQEVMAQVEEEVYGQPSFDDLEMEPLVMKFTIPLAPEITLGDYRAMRKEVEAVEVTEEAVAEALENVQTQHQELETVERAAEAGDVVVVSGKGILLLVEAEEAEEADEAEDAEAEEGAAEETAVAETETEEERTIFNQDSAELLMDSEKVFVGTPVVDNIIGLSAG